MKNIIILVLIITIGIMLDFKTEAKYPEWYEQAYNKCSSVETPDVFIKECIAFELNQD